MFHFHIDGLFIDQCPQVTHDARLLAKVLYGGEGKRRGEIQTKAPRKSSKSRPLREVKFSSGGGKFLVHPSIVCDEADRDILQQDGDDDQHEVEHLSPEHFGGHLEDPCEDDPSCYVWRSQDYSFLPVKSPDQV